MFIFLGARSRLALRVAPLLAADGPVIGFCREPDEASRAVYSELHAIDYRDPSAAIATMLALKDPRLTVVNFATRKVDRLFVDVTPADVDQVLETDLRFNFLVLPPLVRKMVAARWGRIVLLSSTGAFRGDSGLTLYATAKSGIEGLARSLGREYARFGVTANVLSLGYLSAGIFEDLPEKLRAKMLAEIPSHAAGDPANVAEAIRFLVRADHVNASVIPVDGGL